MEGQASPALANLLVHSGRLTGDALAATVVDLAARRHVKLEEITPGQVLCRFPHEPPSLAGLLEHERQTLELLEARAVDGVVRVEALGQGVSDEAGRWWREFTIGVANEGATAGLTRRGDIGNGQFSILNLLLVTCGLVVVFAFFCAAAFVDDPDLSFALVAVWIAGGMALGMAADVGMGLVRLTQPGIALGSQWITERETHLDLVPDDVGAAGVAVRGRPLAYACAVGTAPSVSRGLPRGPDSTRIAWVRRGGMWRRVRLYYPLRLPRGWGRPPLTTVLPALVGVVLSGAVVAAAVAPGRWHPAPPLSDAAARAVGHSEPLVAGLALVVVVLALTELLRGGYDLVAAPREMQGPVVARWVFEGSRWNPWRDLVPCRWYLVIDDGRSATLRGLRVSEDAFHHAHRGDDVRALVGRA